MPIASKKAQLVNDRNNMEKMIELKYCLESNVPCDVLYLEMISRTALTSASTAGESCAARAVRRWEMSQATDHWQRCSRNRSFQHSCSSSTCACAGTLRLR